MRKKFECDQEELTIRHNKSLEDLEKDKVRMNAEMQGLEQAITVIQNEYNAQQSKLENIKRESKLVEEQITLNKEIERHQDSLLKSIGEKVRIETERQEYLEVQLYDQSVKKATMSEDQDKVLLFLEEFIKRQTGAPKPKDNTMFRELSDSDRESVNEILKPIGVHYKEVF